MKGLIVAAWVALLTGAQTAAAELPPAAPTTTPGAAPARSRATPKPVVTPKAHATPKMAVTLRRQAAAKPKPPPEPETPPPADVKLTIEAPAQRGPWTLRLTNDGDIPVTVAADARLLSFEATPRSAPKPQHCELPSDMRPSDAMERALVLPPHRAYVEIFEPRLYCFSGKALDALASGAIVIARLGRPGAGEGGVGVVVPIDGVQPAVAARRFLEAPPIALPDEAPPPRPRPVDSQPDAIGLSLAGAANVDAESPEGIDIPVTLENEGSRPLPVRFRPEMLVFDIVGPSGVERCSWPVLTAAPIREMFTTLPAKSGTTHLTVELGDYCFGHVLDEAGLLAVWPRLDTRRGSGETIGLRSFNGQVASASPTFVRLHRGRVSDALTRPRLEDR